MNKKFTKFSILALILLVISQVSYATPNNIFAPGQGGLTGFDFFFDSANKNSGIGTSTPEFKFSVDGDVWINGKLTVGKLNATSTSEQPGLSEDCDGATQKIVWDLTTLGFGCATDQTGAGGPPNHGTTTITFITAIDGGGWLCTNCPVAGTEYNPGVRVNLDGTNKIRLGANCDVACAATISVNLINASDVSLATATPSSLDTPVLSAPFNESLSGDHTLNIRIKGTAQAAEDFRITHVYAEISPQ